MDLTSLTMNPTVMALWNTIKTNQILLIIVFILFLVVAKKLFNILIGSITIAVISASFPFILNKLGFGMSTDFNTVLYFMIVGVILYILYHIISGIFKIRKIFK